MESYIMSSVELDQQFIDNASDDYMSDEEREYWIDEEEGVTEEEEVVLYEVTEDTAINFAFDTLVGMSREESTKNRKAVKKALVDKVPNIPTYKGVEHQQTKLQNQLANHFNHRGVK